jgi:hypothetical protein
MGLCGWRLIKSPVLVELIWTTRNIQEKGEKPSRAALQYRLFI